MALQVFNYEINKDLCTFSENKILAEVEYYDSYGLKDLLRILKTRPFRIVLDDPGASYPYTRIWATVFVRKYVGDNHVEIILPELNGNVTATMFKSDTATISIQY